MERPVGGTGRADRALSGGGETGLPMPRNRKRLLWISLAGVLLAAGGLAGWSRRGASGEGVEAAQPEAAAAASAAALPDEEPRLEKGPAAVPVSVVPVGTAPVSSYISSTANLVAEDEVRVLAEVEGKVEGFRVEEGDRVSRGEVLATLDREEAQIDLRKAEIRSASARQVYERAIRAQADDLLSDEEFEKKKADMEIAAQELAEARWRLERKTIRAPFAGRVTERQIRPGLHVKPGDPLFTVADFEPLIARIHLPERDILGLEEGREARITLKADESVRFRGRIRQISPVVEPGTGTVKITVEATAPPSAVRPGSFVSVEIVRETRPRALVVPREAVIRELRDSYVFVARGGQAERRSVRLGLEEGGRVEVVSGVAAGEQVIVAGQGGLKGGSRVTVVPASAAPARRDPDSAAAGRDPRG